MVNRHILSYVCTGEFHVMVLGAVLFYVHTKNLCNGAPVLFLVLCM
jgi:hypothetical protein